MKRIVRYFFQGLLYTVPLVVTAYVLYKLFILVDGILKEQIKTYFDKEIPGLGLLVLLIGITLFGFIGSILFRKPLVNLFNRIINKIPLIKVIYSSVRDLLSAFVGKEKKFDQPVLVRVNNITNLEKLGFMTQKNLTNIGLEDRVVVYFPHSYAFSGEHYIVPASAVTPLDVNAADVMKFIVSGGVAKI